MSKDGKINYAKSAAPLASLNPLYSEISAPFKTEMAYLLDNGQTEGVRVYIVGFAIDKIKYKPSKLKFLSGLGYAIYVAAFVLEEEDDEETEGVKGSVGKELDVKELFAPRPLGTPHSSVSNLSGMPGAPDPNPSSIGVWSPKPSRVNLRAVIADNAVRSLSKDDVVGLNIDSPRQGSKDSPANRNKLISFDELLTEDIPKRLDEVTITPPENHILTNNADNMTMIAPTWEPVDAFSYPIVNIPIKSIVPTNLTFHSFEDLKHIADGSNSNIFLGKLLGQKVIVKMIKEDVQNNPVAVHEFDIEHGMLSRFSHPHIIRLLGVGVMPRRFIVIEYLGGGSLNNVLENNKEKPGIAQRFFRKPSFTYSSLLARARDMADALDYLHSRCQPGAIIIHRGNIVYCLSFVFMIII